MNTTRKNIIRFCVVGVLAGCIGNGNLSAQTVLLHVDRATDSLASNTGPNLAKFHHVFIGIGSATGTNNPGAEIITPVSTSFFFGVRAKYKFSRIFSGGYDLTAMNQIYKIKQKVGKVLPDSVNHHVGRIQLSSIGISVYQRTNLDPGRGNTMGTHIDLGVRGGWILDARYIFKDNHPDGDLKGRIKNLRYTQDFDAAILVRIGFSKFSIFGERRLTDVFKKSFGYPELPLYHFGFEQALY